MVASGIGKALRCESLLGVEVDVYVPLPHRYVAWLSHDNLP